MYHVNNDGAYERKTKCRSAMLRAIELGQTEGYQALCRNCNYIKYLEYKIVEGIKLQQEQTKVLCVPPTICNK